MHLKKIDELKVKRTVRLNLAGQYFTYIYSPLTGEVCTPEFPDIPIEKVFVTCGHYLTHDTIRKIIEEKLGLPSYEVLKDII